MSDFAPPLGNFRIRSSHRAGADDLAVAHDRHKTGQGLAVRHRRQARPAVGGWRATGATTARPRAGILRFQRVRWPTNGISATILSIISRSSELDSVPKRQDARLGTLAVAATRPQYHCRRRRHPELSDHVKNKCRGTVSKRISFP